MKANGLQTEKRRSVRNRFALVFLFAPLCALANSINVVTDYKCPNDGSADAAASINQAIQAAKGEPVIIPSGTYLLNASIVPVSGTVLEISPDAEMRRGWDGGNSSTNGALINSFMNPVAKTIEGPVGVAIRGGRWTNPGNKYTGRVLNIYGKRWNLDGLRVESWGSLDFPSTCIGVIGEDITGKNIYAAGSGRIHGQAGIRVLAGAHVRFSDCYIESGDDTFCAFPVENKEGFASGIPLSDVVFERCKGVSYNARFLACGLTVNANRGHSASDQESLNSVTVSNIQFIDCEGASERPSAFAAAFYVALANPSPDAAVRGIQFIRCIGRSPKTAEDTIRVSSSNKAMIGDITFTDCATFGAGKPLKVIGDAKNITFVRHSYNGNPITLP